MDFFATHWGDLASTIGVCVSLIGFFWAVCEVRRARTESVAAHKAAMAAEGEALRAHKAAMGAEGEALRAHRAAMAAKSMTEQVKFEAIESAERRLLMFDIERALSLIQRLKLLHGIGRWDAALEQYHALTQLTSDILAHYPKQETTLREQLSNSRYGIGVMEEQVAGRGDRDLLDEDLSRLNQHLYKLESHLGNMATAIGSSGR